MSSVWAIRCPKCGHRETIHTPMALDDGEIRMAQAHAQQPCPKCGHAPRKLGDFDDEIPSDPEDPPAR